MTVSTTSKRAGSSKSGAGSRASKTFTFRGVKLTKPKEIPDTFGFDYGEVQMLAQAEDAAVVGAMQGLLASILGEEELRKVRSVVKGLGDPWQADLLKAIVELDGLDWGEA